MAQLVSRRGFLEAGATALALAAITPFSISYATDSSDFLKQYAQPGREGIVVGVPFGKRDPQSEYLGKNIAEKNGFGLVLAHVPGPHRVYYPGQGSHAKITDMEFTQETRNVYDEFLKNLRIASGIDSIDHNFVVIVAGGRKNYPYVDAITMGYSPSEHRQIRDIYNRLLSSLPLDVEKRQLLFMKEDRIRLPYQTLQNEGLLLHGNRGIGIVTSGMDDKTKDEYSDLISKWTGYIASKFKPNPNVEILTLPEGIQGRFTRIPGKKLEAIISAPHGWDVFSDHIAEEIARSLDLNALLAHGFTATHNEKLSKINVNRPTEGAGMYQYERHTGRARNIYGLYKERVIGLAQGNKPLLVEVHTNNHSEVKDRIEIATKGISGKTAEKLLETYKRSLNEERQKNSSVTEVSIGIEPLDTILMNAYGAKEVGIIGDFQRAMHFDIPVPLFYSSKDSGIGNPNLEAYTRIMTKVVQAAISLR